MSSHYDYEDYKSIVEDSDDLYYYDDILDNQDIEQSEHDEWENYYHNIASELIDE
jgi:hypothetical protein